MRAKTILIISTDATRTGTPLLLLNYLKWIKENSQFKLVIILENSGELIDDFRELGLVYIWSEPIASSSNRFFNALILKPLNKIFNARVRAFTFLLRIKLKHQVDLIFSNSARNGGKLKTILKTFHKKVVCYVHEGEKTLDIFNSGGEVTYNLNKSNEIITVSNFVKNMLLDKFKLSQNIEIIPGCVELNTDLLIDKTILKAKYNIAKKDIVIMCCGWLGWHKGTDFFIQVAQNVLLTNKNVRFIWVGGSVNDDAYKQIVFDSKKSGIEDKVTIITSVKDSTSYINMCDIFLMLSREESFSLVTLEASLLKKPVLCFDGAGGPCEILNFNKSLMIPYGNINEMVKRVNNLIVNEEERENLGEHSYNFVSTRYDVTLNSIKLLEVLRRNIT